LPACLFGTSGSQNIILVYPAMLDDFSPNVC